MLLPAISQFVSGTVTDTLKNVLRPATLFSAAVFILLNLLFVLNPLIGVESQLGTFVSNVLSVDVVWLATIATILTVILAYILNSLNGAIYSFMTGESWENAYWIGTIAKRLQRIRWERIKQASEQGNDSPTQDRLKYEFRTLFPPEKYLASTALGNVITAHAYILWDRYKIDLTALWAYMQITIADQAELKTSIDNEKNGLDFLLTLSFIIFVFVIECLLLNLFGATIPLLGWHYLTLLLLVYCIYQTCVVKALAWCQAILVAFDLHQETLRKKLAMQPVENRKTAREHWSLLSRQILYGTLTHEEIDPLFDEPKKKESNSATAVASPSVSIAFQHDNVKLKKPLTKEFELEQGHAVHQYASEIHYSILVSNVPKGDGEFDSWPAAQGIFVIVDEQRIPWIDVPPSGGSDWSVHKTALRRLIWELRRNLALNETVKLEYSLPLVIWTATTRPAELKITAENSSISEESEDYVIRLELKNMSSTDLTNCEVEVFDSRIANPDDYEPPEGASSLDSPIGYHFKVPRMPAGKPLRLIRRIKRKSV